MICAALKNETEEHITDLTLPGVWLLLLFTWRQRFTFEAAFGGFLASSFSMTTQNIKNNHCTTTAHQLYPLSTQFQNLQSISLSFLGPLSLSNQVHIKFCTFDTSWNEDSVRERPAAVILHLRCHLDVLVWPSTPEGYGFRLQLVRREPASLPT